MIKKYHRVSEFNQEVLDAQHVTFDKGWSCGWAAGDDYISFKKGFTSYVYSHPHQGKTVWVTESLIHLAKNEGLTVCIYSPETGGKKEVVWNLIQVYAGKRLYGKSANKISAKEIDDAMAFIDKHFIILEHDPFAKGAIERFTVKDIFNQVFLAEKAYDKKIDVLCIDPFNLLDRELEDDRKAIQDYVLGTLSFINSASKRMGMHTILVAHLAGDELVVDKDTGIEYMPKPHPSKLAGGQSFWRAGFQMIGLFREPFGVLQKDGYPYQENCMQVLVQKSKPLGVGKLGMFQVYYNTDTHTIYEPFGDRKYRCGEFNNDMYHKMTGGKNTSLSPSTQWSEPIKSNDEQLTLDSPF